MMTICDIVRQALQTGYLSLDAEEQLKTLLQQEKDREAIDAFMKLQVAAMSGQVRQESWEQWLSQQG